MVKRGANRRWLSILSAAAMGGSLFQLGSCDPTVRTAILGGLNETTNGLLVTLSDAFYLSLQDDETDATGGLTTP